MNLPSDPTKMMEQFKETQQRLQEEVSAVRAEASTGGGMVTVEVDGNKKLTKISISAEATEDVEMLEDMVRGACNEAMRRADEQVQQKIAGLVGPVMGGLGLPVGRS